MAVFCVPSLKEEPWPSLGDEVCRWIEENLVFGPGQIYGEPAKIDEVTRAVIWRAYEVYPRGHELAGRRRFQRVVLSMRKGTAKTEKAAWLVAAELHPEAPVRFAGWNPDGTPHGRGVSEPYIPLLAISEEQSETLTYDAVRSIIQESKVADDFETHLSKIVRASGRGVCEAVTASPGRDGARTTFQVFDETHHYVKAASKTAYELMLGNMPKQKLAEPWSFTTTTAFGPGEGSVAEDDRDYAEMVAKGEVKDPSLFYFHREASDGYKVRRPHECKKAPQESSEDDVRLALREASGEAMWEWLDVEGAMSLWRNPKYPLSKFERLWLNRRVRSASQVFDMGIVRAGYEERESAWPRKRTEITIGFDGSRTQDATALVGTEVDTGYQFLIAVWERPYNAPEGWEVPGYEVDEYVREAFRRWKVLRMLADPRFWEVEVDKWAGLWPKKVVIFPTRALNKTALSLAGYVNSWAAGAVTHDGNPTLLEHMGNARRRELTAVDEEGNPLYIMEKDASDSTKKIDAAYAALLSWEARSGAVSGGALKRAGSKAGRTTVYMG